MVKGFDPAKTDPANYVLEYLFSLYQAPPSIQPIEASSLISMWLRNQNTFTSRIYKQFTGLKEQPQIVIKRHCGSKLISVLPQNGDNYYPGFQKGNKIYLCLDKIKNKIELKENLDRELCIMAKSHGESMQKAHVESDKSLMRALYEGCIEGYRNYAWQRQTEERLSKKCAIYLFRRRSNSDLPPDSLFRYSSKLADELFPH